MSSENSASGFPSAELACTISVSAKSILFMPLWDVQSCQRTDNFYIHCPDREGPNPSGVDIKGCQSSPVSTVGKWGGWKENFYSLCLLGEQLGWWDCETDSQSFTVHTPGSEGYFCSTCLAWIFLFISHFGTQFKSSLLPYQEVNLPYVCLTLKILLFQLCFLYLWSIDGLREPFRVRKDLTWSQGDVSSKSAFSIWYMMGFGNMSYIPQISHQHKSKYKEVWRNSCGTMDMLDQESRTYCHLKKTSFIYSFIPSHNMLQKNFKEAIQSCTKTKYLECIWQEKYCVKSKKGEIKLGE